MYSGPLGLFAALCPSGSGALPTGPVRGKESGGREERAQRPPWTRTGVGPEWGRRQGLTCSTLRWEWWPRGGGARRGLPPPEPASARSLAPSLAPVYLRGTSCGAAGGRSSPPRRASPAPASAPGPGAAGRSGARGRACEPRFCRRPPDPSCCCCCCCYYRRRRPAGPAAARSARLQAGGGGEGGGSAAAEAALEEAHQPQSQAGKAGLSRSRSSLVRCGGLGGNGKDPQPMGGGRRRRTGLFGKASSWRGRGRLAPRLEGERGAEPPT